MNIAREPAVVWVGLVAPAVQLILSFLGMGPELQTVLNALVVALCAVTTALLVKSDRLLPAILGLIQACIVVGLYFGAHISDTQQALIMTVVGGVVAAFLRTQLEAPVPPMQG